MSERKYRQRGYQDDGGDRRERSAPSGPRPPRDPTLTPRGRGLGKPTATVFRCRVCGASNSPDVAAGSTCRKCRADLHTCTHCSHFDTAAARQCRQPQAELVHAKAKRNECEYLKPLLAREFQQESNSQRDAKAAFDALFDL